MLRWVFHLEPDEDGKSLWRWEAWDGAAAMQQSASRFRDWAECVKDAKSHGYANEQGMPADPSAS